ncbi:MAG: sulfotransferase [Myxococcales bacterium]|nr:MAG: sulfotransferase [Myxococcales bacterium]
MTTEYSFRDAELRSRLLRALNLGGGLLARLGARLPSLEPQAMVEAAQRRIGCENLGGDSFREPLEIYLRAVEEEAELSAFGRIAVRGMLVNSLATRGELHRFAREHPTLREERIERPWVIVGLPRTGTSLLSILIGLDPLARAPLHWEAAHPVPPPTLADAAEDPRIARSAREIDQLLRLNPALRAMHPFGATLAQECVAFFMLDLRTLGVETQAHVPSYGRWLEGCDMRPAYAQHRLALQALQSGQPTERWVLKSPNHLWCLETLLAEYPDARVLWTHRDPGPVVTSLASLNNTLQRTFTSRREARPTAEEWRGKAFLAVSRGMAFDASAAAGWCRHVAYPELLGDPVATVEGIYAHFGEAVGSLHRRRMQAWMRERHQMAFGRHRYDPADFGWGYDEIAEQFSAYRERYAIPREI